VRVRNSCLVSHREKAKDQMKVHYILLEAGILQPLSQLLDFRKRYNLCSHLSYFQRKILRRTEMVRMGYHTIGMGLMQKGYRTS